MELPLRQTDRSGRPYVVRYYQPDDRPALEAMYADFEPKRAAQGLPPESPERVRRWLDRVLGVGIHLIVEVGGRVLGHVMLIPMDERTAELANFLHQSIRNRGIGTAMNRVAAEIARQAGYRRLWLSVEPSNRPAIRSYQNAGFRQLPGSLWAPEITMALDLDAPPAGEAAAAAESHRRAVPVADPHSPRA